MIVPTQGCHAFAASRREHADENAGRPRKHATRSRTDARPGPSPASFGRPVRAVTGQRNPSHGPCIFRLVANGRWFAAGVWLLLSPTGAPLVWPAPRLLQWRQRRYGGVGRRAGGYGGSDPDGCRTANMYRSIRHDVGRPNADHSAAAFISAALVAPRGSNHAVAGDDQKRNLISLPSVLPGHYKPTDCSPWAFP